MPLFRVIDFNATTQVLVWKITESFQELNESVELKEKSRIRMEGMHSEIHQRAFLSVRKLLNHKGYTDHQLHYDEFGKPYLEDGMHISISHSHEFSTIIISDQIVGIDLELQREKIAKIAYKFSNEEELKRIKDLPLEEYVKKLTVKWGAKEAIFKIRNEKGISFKDHIRVSTFELHEHQTLAHLHYGGLVRDFRIFYEEIEGFTLVFAFEK